MTLEDLQRITCEEDSMNDVSFCGTTCNWTCTVTILSLANSKEPLNKSSAALSGPFAPTYRFENLEIRKGFLRFPNLNLEQNPSLTTLAI